MLESAFFAFGSVHDLAEGWVAVLAFAYLQTGREGLACLDEVVGVGVVAGVAVREVIAVNAVGDGTQGAEVGAEVEEVALRANPSFDVERGDAPPDKAIRLHARPRC